VTEPPGPDEVEVSLFGPGRGECVVCHLSDNHWIVVDSCVDPTSREPIALRYLEELGVDASTAIKLVVVTHWHDDHIRGISQVLEIAVQARFACSQKNNVPEFFKAIATATHSDLVDSGLDEFSNVMRVLQKRRQPRQRKLSVGPIWASEGLVLHRVDRQAGSPGPVQVMALSPSPATQTLALHELRSFVAERAQPQRRAIALSPNQRSIVLSITTGGPSVLLGGDLEQSANPAVGWEAVVNCPVRPQEFASVFKVPHHGSGNADNPRVWTEMLIDAAFALVAPYPSGIKSLPTTSDVRRLSSRTENLYCTAPPEGWKPPRRESSVERTIRETARELRVVSREVGHIRVRFWPSEPHIPPSIQLAPPAMKLVRPG